MVQESGLAMDSPVARAKALLLSPRDEWPKIAAETRSSRDIFLRYLLPLIAIWPAANLIGGQIFGYEALLGTFRPSLTAAMGYALLQFLLALVCAMTLTWTVDMLAPLFGGISDRQQAFKLTTYGLTAGALALAVNVIPSLFVFSILGLYSVYLFYAGAPPVMKVPPGRAASFTATVFLGSVVIALVGVQINKVGKDTFYGHPIGSRDATGKVNLPGGVTLGVDKAEELGKRMEDAARGDPVPVPVAQMQALLPGSIGAYQRTVTESAALGQVGGQASATYEASPHRFTLKIVDMSALGALAGMGAALGVEQSREDADSYERTQTIDGQIRTEAWNRKNNDGKYGIIVGNRFLIEAEGGAANIDELKAAVATIDPEDLQDLAE